MYKLVNPADWYPNDPVTSLIKAGNRLGSNDKRAFLKTGAAGELAEFLLRHPPGDGMIPVHILATGSTEKYGANRNGDAFSRKWSVSNHPTYVKHARYYRNHVAGESAPFYGLVKASAYNHAMDRTELLAYLFGGHKTASKHGPNAKTADWEQNKLAKEGHFPTSMGCKVDYDICDLCGNQAKTRAEYCGKECPGGGCADNLGKIATVNGDLRRNFVDNYNPVWKDISGVQHPADPISCGIAADYLMKSASMQSCESGIIKSAALGAYFNPSDRAIMGQVLDRLDSQYHTVDSVFNSALSADRKKIAFERFPNINSAQGQEVLAALAENHVVLPLNRFAEWIKQGKWTEFARGKIAAGNTYRELAELGWLDNDAGPYRGTTASDTAVRLVAETAHAEYSLTKQACYGRITEQDVTRRTVIPASVIPPEGIKLAREYSLYRLDACLRIFESDPENSQQLLTGLLSGLQNQII